MVGAAQYYQCFSPASFHGWPSSLSTWCNLRDLYRFIVGTTGMLKEEARHRLRLSEETKKEEPSRRTENVKTIWKQDMILLLL